MLFFQVTQNQRGNLRLNNVSSEFQPPDTWLLSMRGSTNYCPKSNCQRARCRWHRHVQRRKRALRLNRSRKCGCGYSTRRRTTWRRQFPSEIAPEEIALDHGGSKLYIANGASNDVSVVDLKSRKELNRIKVGDGPWGIAVVTAAK
ncbi:MAG: hypothetical protein DME61_04985 [Verrucomicrobia bacterium]|nr:MAG: hypothetical protein DME61_04985 [Verrucomicrobiota bacterium]